MKPLEKHSKAIKELCKKYRVSSLFVFGSVLREDFNEHSDIDFLVDFEDFAIVEYADNYLDFKFSLEDLLEKDVDLLENKAVRNPYFRQAIDISKQRIYG